MDNVVLYNILSVASGIAIIAAIIISVIYIKRKLVKGIKKTDTTPNSRDSKKDKGV